LPQHPIGAVHRPESRSQHGPLRLRQTATTPRFSTEHGEVIDLVYYHEKSVKEIAEIVGIAEATVKTRMFYARKNLADLVNAA
jgi:DNA-directed RNA polymerase specialized sigma24 family protein